MEGYTSGKELKLQKNGKFEHMNTLTVNDALIRTT